MIRSCDRFFDLLALTFPDPDHSGSEEREITIGHSIGGQLLFVSYFERGDRVRIIRRTERKQYEEGIGKESN